MGKEKNAIRMFPDARIPRAVPGRSTGTGGLSSQGTGFPAQVVSFVIRVSTPEFPDEPTLADAPWIRVMGVSRWQTSN